MATIMIVDDNKDVAELMGETLTTAGYTVDVFTSGREAIKCCVDCRYALVISDVNMPDIDGMTLLRMIRAQRPKMPFIFMSGDMAPDDQDAIAEADSFHFKLDGQKSLMRKVEAVLILKGVNAGASQQVLAV